MANPTLTAGKAVHTTDLSGEPPEWVQLLPSGVFVGRDGRGPYQVPNPEEVIRATRERIGADLPIDYGHQLEVAGHEGDRAPAAGWISDFEVREGEIWGRVGWTRSGEEAIRGREYRFLSPVFYHDGDGTVLYLLRAGLTNRPNLRMVSVNSNQGGDTAAEETAVADKNSQLTPVAQALGLGDNADEAAILARCSQASQAQAGLTKVAQSVGLGADATADQVVQAIQARTTPDHGLYVPRSQYDELAGQLRTAQAAEGERQVDAAVAAGKLTPAQRAWALTYHAADPKGFAAFVENQPVVLAPGAVAQSTGGSGGSGRQLDEAEKAICAATGVSEADFLKNKES